MLGLVVALIALWLLGVVLGVPLRVRMAALGILWAAIVLAQLVLPASAPLRSATGGRVEPWLVLGGAAALIWGYRRLLAKARKRAKTHAPAAPAQSSGPFSGVELQRYSRHILLRELGGPGQFRLKNAKVLIVGAGGLGSPALLYLAAAGVGQIRIIDHDVVELSNLQRQIAHTDDRLGQPKVASARAAALAINPHIEVIADQRRLDEEIGREIIAGVDLVLDGTDNFATRYLVNRLCAEARVPLVAAAITQWEGQISVYDPAAGGPCFECVFPEAPAAGLAPSCAEAGVVAPLGGVVGSLMAMEAVKALTQAGEGLRGRLMIYDALYSDVRIIGVKPRAGCCGCGHGADAPRD